MSDLIFTKATNIDLGGCLKLGNRVYTIQQLIEALISSGIGEGYTTVVYCDELPTTDIEIYTIYICNNSLNVWDGSKWISSNNVSDLATVAYTGNWTDIQNKPVLATVAVSGKYTDLTGKPVIPTTLNGLSEKSYNSLTDKPDLLQIGTTSTTAFAGSRGVVCEQKITSIEQRLGQLESISNEILEKIGDDE